MPGMQRAPDRKEEPCNGAKSRTRTQVAAGPRRPYDAPVLTVYGSLVDLTQKRGGPGLDNPGRRRSF